MLAFYGLSENDLCTSGVQGFNPLSKPAGPLSFCLHAHFLRNFDVAGLDLSIQVIRKLPIEDQIAEELVLDAHVNVTEIGVKEASHCLLLIRSVYRDGLILKVKVSDFFIEFLECPLFEIEFIDFLPVAGKVLELIKECANALVVVTISGTVGD